MRTFLSLRCFIAVLFFVPQILLATIPENEEILFHIVRSRDADEIFYQVNLDKEGNLIAGKPVNVFWIRQTQNRQKEPLTWVQNKYAYGLEFLEVHQQYALFRFVSYSGKTFVLQKDDKGTFRVFTTSGDRKMIVVSLFVHFDDDSFWVPKINRIDLHATDVNTECFVVEYLEP